MVVRLADIHDQDTFANAIEPIQASQRTRLNMLSKLAAVSKVGMEIKLHLRMVDFLQIIVLDMVDRVGKEEFNRATPDGALEGYNSNMLKAFLELCLKLGVMEEKGQSIILKDEFKKKRVRSGNDIILAIEKNDVEAIQRLNEKESAFAFVYLAICYKNNISISEEISNRVHLSPKWKKVIHSGQFDYILMFAEYLLGLLKADLKDKISLSQGEVFYTEMGELAFHLYTQSEFTRTIKHLSSISKIDTLIDVGCGFGHYIETASQSVNINRMIGIEIQESVYEIVSEKFKDDQAVSIFNKDVFDFDCEQKADIILLNYVLFYFANEDKYRLFKKLKEMLSETGKIVISQYFPRVESMQKKLALAQKDLNIEKRIAMYFGNIFVYAEVLLNEVQEDFEQSERLDDLAKIVNDCGLQISYITNAERYYYSYYIVLEKKA